MSLFRSHAVQCAVVVQWDVHKAVQMVVGICSFLMSVYIVAYLSRELELCGKAVRNMFMVFLSMQNKR